MNPNIGVLFWGIGIFCCTVVLLTIFLVELSLDKQKRESDGTLRVKDGFIFKYLCLGKPKSLCGLFRGIFFCQIFYTLVLFAITLTLSTVRDSLFKHSLQYYLDGFASSILFVLDFVFACIVIVAALSVVVIGAAVVQFLGQLIFKKISQLGFFVATREIAQSLKRKVCPLVKVVK
ncbi:hypothetical protein A3I18_02160 [Candidatus Campbellbacteria bacterium RIFCSPLOWO2_02_FULL_35_11]|uniref:Uncharacterized protein n=2 Tax=Candidatus Campbelliibacteriota TaxID=1752727 RepID=A0A1F5EPA2_9BACT|nr:MAG: hypothetical protein A3E89_02090 [Candidatus Campbellbacteria bacterium RIFCSPHIGHO2_12_FULL_35_10]OGD69824.1 MAG: hypothetical protein A3I18_02160 [Candidatus Campbellbacteria bacterium RIFCSPLOWO2_02_FULL_35_11]